MLKARGSVHDCLVFECPYCGHDNFQIGFNINDLTVPDPSEGDIEECEKCQKEVLITFEEENE